MRPEHSTQPRPGRPGRADGHHDRPRCHAGGAWAGGSSGAASSPGTISTRGTVRGVGGPLAPRRAGPSLRRSVVAAPSPSDPQNRSCCRLTREDFGYPCSIVEIERRTSVPPLRPAWMPRPERDDEYRCCRCDWVDPSVRPSVRMSRHSCLVTVHSTHVHLQVDPLAPPAWAFPHHHWSSIAPTGRDDQAGRNQQAWGEHRRAHVRKVPVHRASRPLQLMPEPIPHQDCSSGLKRPVMPECVQLAA